MALVKVVACSQRDSVFFNGRAGGLIDTRKDQKKGWQHQSGGTNGGTKRLFEKQNLASMRVYSHL